MGHALADAVLGVFAVSFRQRLANFLVTVHVHSSMMIDDNGSGGTTMRLEELKNARKLKRLAEMRLTEFS